MTGPQDWITTIGLIAATATSAAACIGAVRRVRRGGPAADALSRAGVWAATVLCAAVFIYRALVVHAGWVALESHVDGLALLAAMLGTVIIYLRWTQRLAGVGMFALPVLTLLTLWGVCASWWTFRTFAIGGVWMGVHLLSVYLGAIGVATAAAAGGLWLYVDRMMRAPDHRAQRLRRLGRLGSLESIEHTIVHAATAGFLLLTVGLATGLVIVTGGETKLGPGWWYSSKVILAAVVWVIFALLMHLRYVPEFRGRRAAVLSIVGFALLIAVLGISQALPATEGRARGSAGAILKQGFRVQGSGFRISARLSVSESAALNPDTLNPEPSSREKR